MNRMLILTAIAALAAPATADDLFFSDVFNPTMDDGFIRRSNTDGATPWSSLPPAAGC